MQKLMAIGASDVVGVGATHPDKDAWPTVLAGLLPGRTALLKIGISGGLASQLRPLVVAKVPQGRPDLAVIWTGSNDIANRVPFERYQADLEAMLVVLKAAGTDIYVVNVPDLDHLPAFRPYGAMIQVFVRQWQAGIRALAGRYGAAVVDLSPFTDELYAHPEFICGDGFHPSSKGYQRLAEIIREVVVARRGASV